MKIQPWWVLGAVLVAACGSGGAGGSGGTGGAGGGTAAGGGTGGSGGGTAGGSGGGTAGGSGGGTAGGSGGGTAGGAGGGTAGGSGGAGGGTAGGSGGSGGAGGGTAGGSGGSGGTGGFGGAAACGTSSLDSGCTAFPPLNEPDAGPYKGHALGLYANGNNPPMAHRMEGLARANQIGADGGTYILLSIGYSNATQEFCQTNGISGPPSACAPWTFMGQIAVDPEVKKTGLVVFNGAFSGQVNTTWDEPTDPNYARVAMNLADAGLSPAQVQVGWLKIANPGPSVALPAPNADAIRLERSTADVVRAMKVNYPNLKMVFISSRTYGGWATTPLNPEPYAYEGGLAVKWVVDDQIRQMAGGGPTPDGGNLDYNSVAPWIAWGPYLWTDGLLGRKSDNLVWRLADVENDGTHPSQNGEQKIGTELRQFFKNSPFTRCWFTTDGGSCP